MPLAGDWLIFTKSYLIWIPPTYSFITLKPLGNTKDKVSTLAGVFKNNKLGEAMSSSCKQRACEEVEESRRDDGRIKGSKLYPRLMLDTVIKACTA